jgi:Domain of unknown function (DUF4129)
MVLRRMPSYHARLGREGLDGMSQQRSSTSGRRGDVGGRARLALAACLLAVVAVALRVSLPAPALNGPFRHDGVRIGVVLEAVLACLLVVLMIRHSRAPRDAVLAARLRKLLTYVIVIGLVGIPLAYVLSRHAPPLRPVPIHNSKAASGARLHLLHPGNSSTGALIVGIILAVLAAAGLAYLIVVLLRGRIWLGFRRGPGGLAIEPDVQDDESELREAVASGQKALRRFDDARAAIIACYVAMEESLARAGTARAAADTPDELLVRAAEQGLIRGDAAARLTALFYEARFSSHPMPLRQRDEAQQALAELARSLSDSGLASASGGATGAGGSGRPDGASA